jgi:hypothetical protein
MDLDYLIRLPRGSGARGVAVRPRADSRSRQLARVSN